MKFPKKTFAGLVLAGGGYHALNNYGPEISNAVGYTAGAVDAIIDKGSELVNTISEPIIGSAAPFAFPMIAGGYLGKKLSDTIGFQGKLSKRLSSIAGYGIGAGVGAASMGTILAPYLTVAGAGYAGVQGYKVSKYVLRKTFGGIKGAFSGIKSA